MVFVFCLFIIFSLPVFSLLFKAWLNFGGLLVGGGWVGKGCISPFPGFVLLFLVLLLAVLISSAYYLPSFSPGYHYSHFIYLNRWVRAFSQFLFMFIILFYSIPPPLLFLFSHNHSFFCNWGISFPYLASMTAMCPRTPFLFPESSQKKKTNMYVCIYKLGQLIHSLRVIYTFTNH